MSEHKVEDTPFMRALIWMDVFGRDFTLDQLREECVWALNQIDWLRSELKKRVPHA